jgi:eukaryotic-like serine/threonine-protein kinase
MSAGAVDIHALAAARVGQVLHGKWRLDALLGVGGTACVYAATHRNGKRGAVKLLRPELSSNEEARRRFLREGYVANRIEHPGAVAVLDDDMAEDGSVFLVMELLEGQTLEDYAQACPGRRATPSDTALVVDKLLDVLAAAHDKGIVHRDLKPENVFLTTNGEVKILDFGTARMREKSGAGRMTEVGHIMGTPSFMPPEQALGHNAEIDGRTDLWAVGAMMFYVLTGKLIHEAETINKVLLSAMTRQAPPLGTVAPNVPPPLCEIVDRALMFQREKRWPDARGMQRALRAVRQTLPATSPFLPMSRTTAVGRHPGPMTANVALAHDAYEPASRKGRLMALVAGGLLALAAVVGFVVFVSLKASPSRSSATPPSAVPILPVSTNAAAVAAPSSTPVPTTEASAAPSAEIAMPPSTSTQTNVGTTPRTTTKPTKPTKSTGTKDIFSQW